MSFQEVKVDYANKTYRVRLYTHVSPDVDVLCSDSSPTDTWRSVRWGTRRLVVTKLAQDQNGTAT